MPKTISRLTAAALVATAAFAATPLAAEDKAPLVTVVTSENPQTQLMAMVLTMQAVEQGHAVRMLLCGPGGDLALAAAPEAATAAQPPRGASPQGLMKMIQERGARIEVCAIYLPGKGADASVLLPGVGVAQPPEMAGAMLQPGSVIWSF